MYKTVNNGKAKNLIFFDKIAVREPLSAENMHNLITARKFYLKLLSIADKVN